MNWNNCFSSQRLGISTANNAQRTPYERDFDRMIFSTSFRRLQHKTQVFPLPGPTLVHNRLTHSLEVASVGRSLGKIAGEELRLKLKNKLDPQAQEFYAYHLSSVIAAACLAHDIGNPAFGHSGESAISSYFIINQSSLIDNRELRSFFTDAQWSDLTQFEGNANSFRVLTHSYQNRQPGGFGLTYSTLAAIAKYPCSSLLVDKQFVHRKKYGYFQADYDLFAEVARHTNMHPDLESTSLLISNAAASPTTSSGTAQAPTPTAWKRHPFVFLVEAADDICYRIIDWEDAHRIGIIDATTASSLLIELLEGFSEFHSEKDRVVHNLISLKEDPREQLSYLRAKAINYLVQQAAIIFTEQEERLLNGTLNKALLDLMPSPVMEALDKINKVTVRKIYNHPSVVKIELAGYEVLTKLLETFIPAVLTTRPTHQQKKIRELIPPQFFSNSNPHKSEAPNDYHSAISILDYISGMTDLYAMELYKNIHGIELPSHSAS